MSTVLAIARKHLRQRIRDRSAFVVGVVAAVAIAGLMSLALRGVENFHLSLGVVDLDHGPVTSGVVKTPDEPALRSVTTVRSRARRRRDARSAPTSWPRASSSRRASPRASRMRVPSRAWRCRPARTCWPPRRPLVSSFVAQVNADRLSVSTALAAGAPTAQREARATRAAAISIPVRTVVAPLGAHPLSGISHCSLGWPSSFSSSRSATRRGASPWSARRGWSSGCSRQRSGPRRSLSARRSRSSSTAPSASR